MISFLVTLLIIAVIVYAAVLLVNYLPLPQPVKTIAFLIVGLIGLLYLLSSLGLYTVPLR